MRRCQVRPQRESLERSPAGRLDVLRVALLRELQEIGARQVRERGSETRVARDHGFEQRDRRLERTRPVVMGQKVARAPVVLLHGQPAAMWAAAPDPVSPAGAGRRSRTPPRSRRPRASTTTRDARGRAGGGARRAATVPMPTASDSAAASWPALAKRLPGSGWTAFSTTWASDSGRSGRVSSRVRRAPPACAARRLPKSDPSTGYCAVSRLKSSTPIA